MCTEKKCAQHLLRAVRDRDPEAEAKLYADHCESPPMIGVTEIEC